VKGTTAVFGKEYLILKKLLEVKNESFPPFDPFSLEFFRLIEL
jgi:hypothetical protein